MDTSYYSQTGGARIGESYWTGGGYGSWPFASIQVAPGSLTICLFKKYVFTPSEVRAVEPVGWIPVLTTGIIIHHTRSDYPECIRFYSGGSRKRLLEAIRTAGFPIKEPA